MPLGSDFQIKIHGLKGNTPKKSDKRAYTTLGIFSRSGEKIVDGSRYFENYKERKSKAETQEEPEKTYEEKLDDLIKQGVIGRREVEFMIDSEYEKYLEENPSVEPDPLMLGNITKIVFEKVNKTARKEEYQKEKLEETQQNLIQFSKSTLGLPKITVSNALLDAPPAISWQKTFTQVANKATLAIKDRQEKEEFAIQRYLAQENLTMETKPTEATKTADDAQEDEASEAPEAAKASIKNEQEPKQETFLGMTPQQNEVSLELGQNLLPIEAARDSGKEKKTDRLEPSEEPRYFAGTSHAFTVNYTDRDKKCTIDYKFQGIEIGDSKKSIGIIEVSENDKEKEYYYVIVKKTVQEDETVYELDFDLSQENLQGIRLDLIKFRGRKIFPSHFDYQHEEGFDFNAKWCDEKFLTSNCQTFDDPQEIIAEANRKIKEYNKDLDERFVEEIRNLALSYNAKKQEEAMTWANFILKKNEAREEIKESELSNSAIKNFSHRELKNRLKEILESNNFDQNDILELEATQDFYEYLNNPKFSQIKDKTSEVFTYVEKLKDELNNPLAIYNDSSVEIDKIIIGPSLLDYVMQDKFKSLYKEIAKITREFASQSISEVGDFDSAKKALEELHLQHLSKEEREEYFIEKKKKEAIKKSSTAEMLVRAGYLSKSNAVALIVNEMSDAIGTNIGLLAIEGSKEKPEVDDPLAKQIVLRTTYEVARKRLQNVMVSGNKKTSVEKAKAVFRIAQVTGNQNYREDQWYAVIIFPEKQELEEFCKVFSKEEGLNYIMVAKHIIGNRIFNICGDYSDSQPFKALLYQEGDDIELHFKRNIDRFFEKRLFMGEFLEFCKITPEGEESYCTVPLGKLNSQKFVELMHKGKEFQYDRFTPISLTQEENPIWIEGLAISSQEAQREFDAALKSFETDLQRDKKLVDIEFNYISKEAAKENAIPHDKQYIEIALTGRKNLVLKKLEEICAIPDIAQYYNQERHSFLFPTKTDCSPLSGKEGSDQFFEHFDLELENKTSINTLYELLELSPFSIFSKKENSIKIEANMFDFKEKNKIFRFFYCQSHVHDSESQAEISKQLQKQEEYRLRVLKEKTRIEERKKQQKADAMEAQEDVSVAPRPHSADPFEESLSKRTK